jgi:hypothetical protein
MPRRKAKDTLFESISVQDYQCVVGVCLTAAGTVGFS